MLNEDGAAPSEEEVDKVMAAAGGKDGLLGHDELYAAAICWYCDGSDDGSVVIGKKMKGGSEKKSRMCAVM